jgi:hypothetical protein
VRRVPPIGTLGPVSAVAALLAALVLGLLGSGGAAAATAGQAPERPFPQRIDLPDGFFPEGITTGRGTTVFVGSLADGAIWRGDVRTGAGEVFVPGREGGTAAGVDYDRRNDRIWVAGGPLGTLTAYDASTGALLETYAFGAGFLNDVVVTRRAVYATDSFTQRLAVVPLGRGGSLQPPTAAASIPLTGEIAYVPGEFNANGIVAYRGGRVLVLVQSVTGALFRVDPATGVARRIDLGGDDVLGGDGLERRGRTLYVVRGGENLVSVVRLGGALRRGRVAGTLTGDLDVPTTATLAAGRLWAVNARFSTPTGPDVEYWITQLPLR